jgi:transcriptional regulator with XRE-family HTH domain
MPTYVADLRKYRFLTQRELANAATLAHRTILDIEAAEVAGPHPSTLPKLAAAFENRTAALLTAKSEGKGELMNAAAHIRVSAGVQGDNYSTRRHQRSLETRLRRVHRLLAGGP